MSLLKSIVDKYNRVSLILRILIGLIIGTILGLIVPKAAGLVLLGEIFVGALKAIAPILVFVLIVSAFAAGGSKLEKKFGFVLWLYMISTFMAAVAANVASFLFPVKIIFPNKVDTSAAATAPQTISSVLSNLVKNMVDNPIHALSEANYIGILFWSVMLGIALRILASDKTKVMLTDISDGVSQCVRWIINVAPFGIMGLVYNTVSTNGLKIFRTYGQLILVLVGTMLVVALIIDPFISFLTIHRNPYPLVFRCLRESGLTAFFTRSSAANIPVNMRLCERLGLDKDLYSVSIPLGATINMDGAAITISIMTLATAYTLGIHVSVPTAVILSFLSALAACGASGVAGGSLLLIPMDCSLFGISNDIAMQTVAVGYIIGVVQDSVETALNSSGDVMFAATAEYRSWQKKGKSLPTFLGGTTKVDI